MGCGKVINGPRPQLLFNEVRWSLGARPPDTPRGSSPVAAAAAAARSGFRDWSVAAKDAELRGLPGKWLSSWLEPRIVALGARSQSAGPAAAESKKTGSGGWIGPPSGARAPSEQAASRSPWSAAGTPASCCARCSAVCFSQVGRYPGRDGAAGAHPGGRGRGPSGRRASAGTWDTRRSGHAWLRGALLLRWVVRVRASESSWRAPRASPPWTALGLPLGG